MKNNFTLALGQRQRQFFSSVHEHMPAIGFGTLELDFFGAFFIFADILPKIACPALPDACLLGVFGAQQLRCHRASNGDLRWICCDSFTFILATLPLPAQQCRQEAL